MENNSLSNSTKYFDWYRLKTKILILSIFMEDNSTNDVDWYMLQARNIKFNYFPVRKFSSAFAKILWL